MQETSKTVTRVAAPRALDRISWGALFAGFFVGFGTLFLLLSLGAAIGLSAVDPRDLGSWKSMGIGVGVWGGLSAIIAAFFSAWVAARVSTAPDRGGGLLHGVALWGVTWAFVLWAGATAVGGILGSAKNAVASATGSAGGALSSVSPSAVTDELVQQANAWLRDHGKPAVPREQMQAALQDVASNAMNRIRSGDSPAAAVQEDAIVTALSRNTNLSRADAQELATQVRGWTQQALSGVNDIAPQVADAAASGASKGAWGAFGAALLTLLASGAGGALGVPRRARRDEVGAFRPVGGMEPQHT